MCYVYLTYFWWPGVIIWISLFQFSAHSLNASHECFPAWGSVTLLATAVIPQHRVVLDSPSLHQSFAKYREEHQLRGENRNIRTSACLICAPKRSKLSFYINTRVGSEAFLGQYPGGYVCGLLRDVGILYRSSSTSFTKFLQFLCYSRLHSDFLKMLFKRMYDTLYWTEEKRFIHCQGI